MLIRKYLWPLIKRFKGLFLTMTFLAAVGVTNVIGIIGPSSSIEENFSAFCEDSNTPDVFVNTELLYLNEQNVADIEALPSVDYFDIECYLPLSTYLNDKQGTRSTHVYTFSLDQHYKPTIENQVDYIDGKTNIYVENSFAQLNDINPGDYIQVGYKEKYIEAHVVGLIKFPDTLKYAQAEGITSTNKNFGRLYLEKNEMKNVVDQLYDLLKDEYNQIELLFINDLTSIKDNIIKYQNRFGNQFQLYSAEGYTQEETLEEFSKYLTDYEIEITSSYTFENSSVTNYMGNNVEAFKKIGTILGFLIFVVMIFVISLFLNQLFREMIRDVGIFSALGYKKENIMLLLSMFALCISVLGSIIGIFTGHAVEFLLDRIIQGVMKYPLTIWKFRLVPTLIAVIATIVVSQIATLFTSFSLLKITPIEALSNCPSKRRKISEKLDKAMLRASPSLKIVVNSVATKPKRFITSFFAIFSSLLITFIGLTFSSSYNVAVEQTFNKCLNYDAQVVMGSEEHNFEEWLAESNIDTFEKSKYANIEIEYNGQTFNGVLQGLNTETNKISIPKNIFDSNPVPTDGIVINKNIAKMLKIPSDAETIMVNGKVAKIAYFSNFETFPICICNIDSIEEYSENFYDCYFLENVDHELLMKYVTNYQYSAVVTFTDDMKLFFENNFKPIKIFCYLFSCMTVLLSALIVTLMMQTTLVEQQRDISIMRSLGYPMSSISGMWSLQTLSEFVLAAIIGTPLSIFASKFLASNVYTKISALTAYISVWNVLLAYGIIFLFLAVSHVFCINSIKKWNIADNTKNRES